MILRKARLWYFVSSKAQVGLRNEVYRTRNCVRRSGQLGYWAQRVGTMASGTRACEKGTVPVRFLSVFSHFPEARFWIINGMVRRLPDV